MLFPHRSMHLFAFIVPTLASTLALGSWPTDPSSPLTIGTIEGIFGERQSVVVTDDQGIWVSWQDSFCGGFSGDGSVRVQRIAPDGSLLTPAGIDAQEDPTCGFLLPPLMLASQNAVVVTRAQSTSSDFPIQSYLPDGSPRWAGGYSVSEPQGLGVGTTLGNADVLLTSSTFGGMIHVDRIDTAGQRVWAGQTVFQNDAGTNFKLLACVPDALGGSYIFWDSPGPYRRFARVRRINADGSLAWTGSVRIMGDDMFNQGSRFTPPVAVGDGLGGAVFVWAHGQESGFTPVPIKLQHIDASGVLRFGFEGVRVSLSTLRQFDAAVRQDAASGDMLIVWRNGQLDQTTVRAQRMTLAGARLWGDEGVEIDALQAQNNSFAPVWIDGQLAVAIADDSGVRVHRIDGSGSPLGMPWIVGASGAASSVSMNASMGGLVVSWQQDEPGTVDLMVAQRINMNGLLGGPMCSPADITGDGSLDIFDVFAFLDLFATSDPLADMTGDGAFDIFDVFAYLDAFNAGCP